MRRLWTSVVYLLALLVVVAALLPFTTAGTRFLLSNAGRVLPLEIEYGGGSLAGELEIRRLAWDGGSLRLELADVVLELVPACWWRSVVCFRQLRAARLDLDLLSEPAGQDAVPDTAPVADRDLVKFPVRLEAPTLAVDATRVRWQGGEWRQGRLEGAVIVTGSAIQVVQAVAREASLELRETSPPSGDVTVLPEIDLPLELLVDSLVLERPAWDLYGFRQALQALSLQGRWRRREVQVEELGLVSEALGTVQARGEIRFAGDWPTYVDAGLELAELPDWPAFLGRRATFQARGDLASLEVQAAVEGEPAITATAEMNTLAPGLPFQLSARAQGAGDLQLSALAALPEALSELTLTGPVLLSGNGDLAEQSYQLQAGGRHPAYGDLDLQIAGRHRDGLLVVEDMRVADAAATNTLWSSGELRYGERLVWSLAVETAGLDFSAPNGFASGRFEGSLHLDGESDAAGWWLAFNDIDLQGSVNDLPAHIRGFTGLGGDLQLLASDLQAQLNGTSLVLQAGPEAGTGGRLDLTVDELARWQPDSRGSLVLHADVAADWRHISFEGSVAQVEWQGVEIGGGEVRGDYRPGAGPLAHLDLQLSGISWYDLELDSLQLGVSSDEREQVLSLRSRGDVAGSLELAGAFSPGGDWSGQLASTAIQSQQGTWHLGEAVAVDWIAADSQLRIAGHCWQYQQSRLCPGETLVGSSGSTSLAATGGMEFIAELLPVDFEVHGTLQGQLAARWSPAAPFSLDGSLETRDVSLTRHYGGDESATVRWDDSKLSLRNGSEGFAVTGEVIRDGHPIIDLALTLPRTRSEPLVGTVHFVGLQLSTVAPFAPELSTLEGELHASLQLRGTVDEPQAWGSMRLAGGSMALVGNPTELRQLDVELDVQGDRAEIRGTGLLGGGPLNIRGRLLSRPTLWLDLALEGGRHELLLPPYTQALVSEQLKLTYAEGQLDVNGTVVVHEGVLQHEELPQGSVRLSEDVVEVDYRGNPLQEGSAFATSLELQVDVEDRFMIVGDMINATLGGDLQLLQSAGQPLQVFGNLNVIGGELRAYSQHLRIQRGTVSFSGPPDNPALDVRALREIPGERITVGLQLQGTLERAQLEVFSDPVMSQGETMSYLVRGRGLDSGAGADGVAMALSMGSGLVNRSALVAELNQIPGVSNLAFGAEGSTEQDTAATVGGYLGERLYLSYGMGIYEPIAVLTARLYLQSRLWLEVVSRLENSVDLYYSFDID